MEGPGLRIRIRASRQLLVTLVVLHALALLGLGGVGVAPACKALLSSLLLAAMAWQLRGFLLLRRSAGLELECRDGLWRLDRGGACGTLTLRDDTVLLPFGVVLRLQHGRRVRTILIFPDALEPGQMRRLRVLLRFCAHAGRARAGAGGQPPGGGLRFSGRPDSRRG